MNEQINIIADYREVRSTLPEILKQKGAAVKICNIKVGDYIINDQLVLERKTKEDFVLSLINHRLFEQCSFLKKTGKNTVLLLEGNPYSTVHRIKRQAIQGALISIAVAWQLPLLYSKDLNGSAEAIIMAANQMKDVKHTAFSRGNKPRRIKNQALYFLQGLPGVGPITASSLIKKFTKLESILLASEEELGQVEGIGKGKAKAIRGFLENTSWEI